MAIHCRAKDPSSCRVHGTSGSYEKLQEVADQAALSGDMKAYLSARAEMDALTDDAENFNLTSADKIAVSDDAVEAAASGRWDAQSWAKMDNRWKDFYRAETRWQLEAAVPHIKKSGRVEMVAVNAFAKAGWEAVPGNGDWATAHVADRKMWRTNARDLLTKALPLMVENSSTSTQVETAPELLPDTAVEAAASSWQGEDWKRMGAGLRNLSMKNARVALAAGVPHMRHGQIPTAAVEAIAKAGWEARGIGAWSRATATEKLSWRIRADKMLVAAAPHIKLQ